MAALSVENPPPPSWDDVLAWSDVPSALQRRVDGYHWRGGLYSGPVNSAGMPHGRGVLTFPNGDEYRGGFVRGVRWGAKCAFRHGWDGSFYVGGFAEGVMHGNGTWVPSGGGDAMDGEWVWGKVVGGSSSSLEVTLRNHRTLRALAEIHADPPCAPDLVDNRGDNGLAGTSPVAVVWSDALAAPPVLQDHLAKAGRGGAPAANLFGAAQPAAGLFGAPAGAKPPLFGQPAPAWGAQAAPLGTQGAAWGAAPSAAAAAPGTPTAAPFGAPAAAWGSSAAPSTAPASAWGAAPAAGGPFGAAAVPTFGAPTAAPAWGGAAPAAATTQGSFGAPAPAFGASVLGAAPAFGAPASGTAFGAPAAATAWGAPFSLSAANGAAAGAKPGAPAWGSPAAGAAPFAFGGALGSPAQTGNPAPFAAWGTNPPATAAAPVPTVVQAITRVVAASGGKLNWDVRKDVSSWNCVTVAGAGANFSVKFGFEFSSRVDLADLVQIFGAKLASLDVANQPKLKGDIAVLANCKSLSVFNAYRCPGITGDIAVLANCKSLSVFYANRCEGITGDIVVLQHCPNIKEFYGGGTGITGDIAVLVNCKSLSAFDAYGCRGITGDKTAIQRALPKCSFSL